MPFSGSAKVIKERYGNLFEMYERITGEDPYTVPMRIYPAIHYTMGGLWVDYNLMSTIPGLYVIGEANFSDHGANRLGASALMQGLADGYFILPYTIGDYLASTKFEKVDDGHAGRSRGGVATWQSITKRLLCDQGHAVGGFASIANWARSCGTTAACRATPPGCSTRWKRFRRCASNSGSDVECPGRGRGAEPVAGKSRARGRFLRACRVDVPGRAGRGTNPAAATSARSTRRRKAKRCAMTRDYVTWRPGSSRRGRSRPRCTRSR